MPDTYIVAGAGAAAANGTDYVDTGESNGERYYVSETTDLILYKKTSSNYWTLGTTLDGAPGTIYYYTTGTLSGAWTTTGYLGSDPPPTVTLSGGGAAVSASTTERWNVAQSASSILAERWNIDGPIFAVVTEQWDILAPGAVAARGFNAAYNAGYNRRFG